MEEAERVYWRNFDGKTFFERALFFSWYCKYADCAFCYMSTLKDMVKNPVKGRRTFASILAEAVIAKQLGWKIEFLSGGYDSYSKEELLFLVKAVKEIMKEKQWLNIGVMSKKELEMFRPYIKGYAGTVETVSWELRKKLCPSKKLEPIMETFSYCDELKLKKAMTLIIGLGETIDDFDNLKKFIKKNNISRITFYSLNPHPGTPFKSSPGREYYAKWVSLTRISFPKIEIIAGAWTDKTGYYYALLKAGANSITKIPAMRKFGSDEMKRIEGEVKRAGRSFQGTLTKMPKINFKEVDKLSIDEELKNKIKEKIKEYINKLP